MGYVIGCLMAALSFLINKALLKYIGPQVIITYSPVVEEGCKTLLAYYLDADIFITHATFGVLEAGYDWCHAAHHHGLKAALFSIGGHSLFGLITLVGIKVSDSIIPGLIAGIIIHLIWNITVVRVYTPEKG